jgi:hypothetical protein
MKFKVRRRTAKKGKQKSFKEKLNGLNQQKKVKRPTAFV